MPESTHQKNNSGLIIGIVSVIAVIGIIAVIVFVSNKPNSSVSSAVPVKSPETTSIDMMSGTSMMSTSTMMSGTSPYKDGTYKARGSYNTPEGSESITVSLTLKDGIITDANVIQEGKARESKEYQTKFAAGYKQYVIGKSISSLSLSRVSGSSLTPIGFNNALANIKTQAQA